MSGFRPKRKIEMPILPMNTSHNPKHPRRWLKIVLGIVLLVGLLGLLPLCKKRSMAFGTWLKSEHLRQTVSAARRARNLCRLRFTVIALPSLRTFSRLLTGVQIPSRYCFGACGRKSKATPPNTTTPFGMRLVMMLDGSWPSLTAWATRCVTRACLRFWARGALPKAVFRNHTSTA